MIPPLPRSHSLGVFPATAVLALAAVIYFSGCQSPSRLPDGRRLWPAKASPAILGENVVAIFMPDDWPARLPETDQEIYAQWGKTLEEFINRSHAVKEVRRVDFRTADEVFYGHGLPINEFTLLFIRGDNMALYAPEPIFEGAVYDYVDAFLKGRESDYISSGVLHAGEFETSMPRALKLVRIKAALVRKPPPKASMPGEPKTLPNEPSTPSSSPDSPPLPVPSPSASAQIPTGQAQPDTQDSGIPT